MLTTMERNRNAIEHDLASISFYMQGGLSFSDAHMLTADQRKMMGKIIEKHYEAMSGQKGSKLIG